PALLHRAPVRHGQRRPELLLGCRLDARGARALPEHRRPAAPLGRAAARLPGRAPSAGAERGRRAPRGARSRDRPLRLALALLESLVARLSRALLRLRARLAPSKEPRIPRVCEGSCKVARALRSQFCDARLAVLFVEATSR